MQYFIVGFHFNHGIMLLSVKICLCSVLFIKTINNNCITEVLDTRNSAQKKSSLTKLTMGQL